MTPTTVARLPLKQIATQDSDAIVFDASSIATIGNENVFLIFYLSKEDEFNGYGTVVQLDPQTKQAAIYADLNPEYTYLFYANEQGELQTLLWCIEVATQTSDGLFIAHAKSYGRGISNEDLKRFQKVDLQENQPQAQHNLTESYAPAPAPTPATAAAPAPTPAAATAAMPATNSTQGMTVPSAVENPISPTAAQPTSATPAAPQQAATAPEPAQTFPTAPAEPSTTPAAENLPQAAETAAAAPSTDSQNAASTEPAADVSTGYNFQAQLAANNSLNTPLEPSPAPAPAPAPQANDTPRMDAPASTISNSGNTASGQFAASAQPNAEPALAEPTHSDKPLSFIEKESSQEQSDFMPQPETESEHNSTELNLPPLGKPEDQKTDTTLPTQSDGQMLADILQPIMPMAPQGSHDSQSRKDKPAKQPVGRPPKPLLQDQLWSVSPEDFVWVKNMSRQPIAEFKDSLHQRAVQQIRANKPGLMEDWQFTGMFEQAFASLCTTYDLIPAIRHDILKSLLNGRVVENIRKNQQSGPTAAASTL